MLIYTKNSFPFFTPVVREKENLMLTCATSGDPKPTVSWSRKDGWAVIDGPSKRASYVSSPVLNITHINRQHMGIYICEAFNGVPPNDTQEFNVHVYCKLHISIIKIFKFLHKIFFLQFLQLFW